MRWVPGRIFWDPTLPELRAPGARALYEGERRVLALHRVDCAAAGSATTAGRRASSPASRALVEAVSGVAAERIRMESS